MADLDKNPYAPPKASVASGNDLQDAPLPARSVLFMLLLTLVTFGFYPYIWLHFTGKRLHAQLEIPLGVSPVFAVFAWVLAAAEVSFLALTFTALSDADMAGLDRVLNGVHGVFILIWSFRIKGILDTFIARTGRGPYRLSWLAVVFFTVFYLQFKINRLPAANPEDLEDDE